MTPTPVRFLLAAVVLLGLPAAAQENAWKAVVSKEGGFEVAFPFEATYQKQTVETKAGPMDVHIHMAARAGSRVFIVGFSDIPQPLLDGKTSDQSLRAEIDDSLRPLKAKRTAETDRTISGHPGKETFAETESGFLVTSRAYLVKNRYIQLMALYSKAEKDAVEADATKFLDSLKLAEKKE